MRLLYIFGVIFIIVVFVLIKLKGGGRRFPWYEFYSRGRREGFSFKEINFLRKIVIENKLEKPQSIFWSTKQLDKCLRPAIQKINSDENLDENYKLYMITKLLELRKKAEFNLPKYKKRIRETTAILPRQKLIVKDKDYGTYIAWVIEVARKYLVISKPSGHSGWEGLNWKGRKIGVYFWRHEDAGYYFETKVLEDISHEEYPLLYIAHSNDLKRMQKRSSVRVETRINARFYPVVQTSVEGVPKVFVSKRGHSGKILDLSEGGCCMAAGKGLKKNTRLKIEFFLTGEKKIVALGTVVNVSKTGDDRVRKYHIMFNKLSPVSRNNILLYVFNIFGEREEPEEKGKKRISPSTVSKTVNTKPA